MKITRGYILLAVAAVALIVVWYVARRNKQILENFVGEVVRTRKIPYEKFTNSQKEVTCSTFEKNLKEFQYLLKVAPTTAQEREDQVNIQKGIEEMKKEMTAAGCQPV